MNQYVGRWPG